MNIELKSTRPCRYLSPRMVVLFLFFGLLPAFASHARTAEFARQSLSGKSSETTARKLVGTAVTTDPIYSLAIVEDQNDRRQRLFHEGDRTGPIIIRKIRPGHLVIEVGGRERLVRVGHYLVSESGPPPKPSATITGRPGFRELHRVVDRQRATAALSDTQEVFDSVDISVGRLFNRERGIRIATFGPQSIFSEMGLRSGDLLLRVNGREISGPEEASAFFDQVMKGGDLDLTVRRRARTYHINLLIQ